jgi:alkylation response protein AidB-like acyl-CoA dehydrogenase
MTLKTTLPDSCFLLFDVLQAAEHWQRLPDHAETDGELARQVLEEASAFIEDRIAPLQRIGDQVGCRFDPASGTVVTPPGFVQSYRDFQEAGWTTLARPQEDGGQGLPSVIESVVDDMLSQANQAWNMAPGLLHGACECLRHAGSDALRTEWLPQLVSGESLTTMSLTESHAGSDLGLLRTSGVPQPDGSVLVSGSKIFISGGEHDLTPNIIHLVLGRLPQAPSGPRGLSLFLVPKILPDGSRNAVVCDGIEHKMGLHGSSTCSIRFDNATGWLLGEPHQGLAPMFRMMNAARLHVAFQGVGLLEAAWQIANAYAEERRQMRAPGAQATSLLAEHPAVRRHLDVQRSWIDAGRLLGYRTALALDDVHGHPDEAVKKRAERWCSLITPVLKAALTAQAFQGASDCLQVLGGHGYVEDWGIEQIVRDARVTMIYEGTNEIQAIDLLVRKTLVDGGANFSLWLDDLLEEGQTGQGHADLASRAAELREMVGRIHDASQLDSSAPYRVADDWLQAVAVFLLDWAWQRIAQVMPLNDVRWTRPAQTFAARVLPTFDSRLALVARQL